MLTAYCLLWCFGFRYVSSFFKVLKKSVVRTLVIVFSIPEDEVQFV